MRVHLDRGMLLACAVLTLSCDDRGPAEDPGPAKTAPSQSEPAKAVEPAAAPAPPAEPPPPTDPAPIASTQEHPFSARDLLAMDRVSGHTVSPDGKTVAFVRRVTDLAENKGLTDIWTVALKGGAPKRITNDPASDGSPQFSADGTSIFFISGRGDTSQVWRATLEGGNATKVTDLPLPVGNLVVSPSGKHLAVTMEVFVDCETLDCTTKRLEERKQTKQTGQYYNRMFVRHWDTWKDGRRSHLFVVPIGGEGDPVDVTSTMDADVPTKPFGGSEEIAFAPDGGTVVFTARVAGREEAWSTNFDLFAATIDGAKIDNLTDANDAWDTHPVFGPDGKTLVWTAMKRPGYEADRFRIMKMSWPDRGATKAVAPAWDRSPRDLTFAPEGDSLFVTAGDTGQVKLFRVDLTTGTTTPLVEQGTVSGPAIAGEDVVYAKNDLSRPSELFAMPQGGGEERALTAINADKVAAARTGSYEQFQFKGAGGDTVYGYLVKPVDFDDKKTYPVAFLIHGGPQGSFGNRYHYRWNPQVYAGAGYAAVMIDFHGSTGYGQKFTDSIRGDWGGKPLVDLQKGLAHATETYPFLNADRVCALGASYGGFMVNWIAGKWADRFVCLVNHDGVFDQRMMYYATEELWFPEWEHGGPYYARARAFEKHNPAAHVAKWRTPMFIVHGALDFRVPLTQGLAAFTAAQRRGVPSELLVFADENHWVLAPANSLQWHDAVLGWLGRHLQAK